MKSTKFSIILVLFACLMFGFGFALIPLYNTLCQALGINGKPKMLAAAYDANTAKVDYTRTVLVQFVATRSSHLSWQFYPEIKSVRIHPGEIAKLAFYAENQTAHPMTVQAIPSVTPGIAAKYIKKTVCFCFEKQTLNGHEAMHMPLWFHLDVDFPRSVHTMTLAYTLYDVTGK